MRRTGDAKMFQKRKKREMILKTEQMKETRRKEKSIKN